ncbi:MAG TPA: phage antirepressor N-terminal domain-containing protein [Herpetosiphonaceae bacterium]|nr:phage antirepressor N-terminal domain-containing protein [Herpetosiphonaceae bacterium]
MADEALAARTVPFYDDTLVAVQQPDGTIYAHFARLCENLGMNRPSAARRVQQHEVLQEGFTTFRVVTDGGVQAVQCLRVDLVPLWLAAISARRVKPELRGKMVRYQREAAQVLWQAFRPQVVPDEGVSSSTALGELQRIADLGRAITRLAEQQMELEREQRRLDGRVDGAARVIRAVQSRLDGFELRLLAVEDRTAPEAAVDDAQAAEIKERVKALALLLSGRDASRNHYQGIFAELYRRFGVTSYKLIPQAKYQAVLEFLDEWRAGSSSAGQPDSR